MDALRTLMAGLARCPEDDTGWLALADLLGEQGEDDRAELVRVQLGLRRHLGDAQWPAWQRRQQELWRAGVGPSLPTLSGPFGMEFVLIPPGAFWMGAAEDQLWRDADEQPRRVVSVPHGFYLGRHPVTQRQYAAMTGTNPAHAQDVAGARPVETVAHADCLLFCRRLGRALGRRCRLPTEAEWEYACRA